MSFSAYKISIARPYPDFLDRTKIAFFVSDSDKLFRVIFNDEDEKDI